MVVRNMYENLQVVHCGMCNGSGSVVHTGGRRAAAAVEIPQFSACENCNGTGHFVQYEMIDYDKLEQERKYLKKKSWLDRLLNR